MADRKPSLATRGPDRQYDIKIQLTVTHAQDELLESLATLMNCSKAEVIRRLIDAVYPVSLVQYVKEN